MKDNAEILAEHYQKTYELTYELWKQRNQTFLILLAVIGAATLLTFSATQTNPLLVRWIAKVLDVTDKQDIQELGKSFPFGLLQSLLLIVIFYLVVNLYHRALYVLRNYWSDRAFLQSAVKWCYIVLVGCLLFAFLGGRIYEDFRTRTLALAVVDLVISIATSLFFLAYARSSVSMDTEKAVLHIKGIDAAKES